MRAWALVLVLLALGSPVEARQARSQAVLREFQLIMPCPATGLRRGPCPGWQKDHKIALECGGPDSVFNLQWLTLRVHQAKTREDNARCLVRKRTQTTPK